MRRTSVVSVIATGWLVAGCGIGTGSSDSAAAEDLVDRSFVSKSVVKEGKPQALVQGPLEVSFRYPPDNPERDSTAEVVLGWTSGCNHFGLGVEVSDERLEDESRGHDMTQIDCEPDMADEERWLTAFFTDSPRWELEGSDLSLVSNDVEIELEEGSRASE